LAAADAGASIVHIHVRDPDTKEGCRSDALYEEVVSRIREQNTEVIINLTAGMGGDAEFGAVEPLPLTERSDLIGQEQRLSHVRRLRPDVCTLDCGSYNVGEGNLVYVSPSAYIRTGTELIRTLNVKPELEVFDLGHLAFVIKLIDEGLLETPAMIQFCLGVSYGAPATTATMKTMADMVQGRNIVWSSFGVGRDQFRMVAQAVLLGGHVRVGLEDNLYLKKGVVARNEELVSQAADIINLLGGCVMSCSDARELLSLK